MNAYLWNAVLTRICSSQELEGHWLGVLSLLEYVGCRKILKGVPYQEVDVSVLKHIQDEAGHALQLKTLAEERVGKHPFGSGLFDVAGWEYFQAVDRLSTELLLGKQEPYPVVSWAIERRVFRVYPFYRELTTDEIVKHCIGSILVQEREHRTQFEAVHVPETVREQISECEEQSWEKFVLAIEKIVPQTPTASQISH